MSSGGAGLDVPDCDFGTFQKQDGNICVPILFRFRSLVFWWAMFTGTCSLFRSLMESRGASTSTSVTAILSVI